MTVSAVFFLAKLQKGSMCALLYREQINNSKIVAPLVEQFVLEKNI
jgi:hypothetical protein